MGDLADVLEQLPLQGVWRPWPTVTARRGAKGRKRVRSAVERTVITESGESEANPIVLD